jgi:hypothetical protein
LGNSSSIARYDQIPTIDRSTSWANNCPPETRTIRPHVFSVRIKSVVVTSKVAAVHHAGGGFLRLATAFDPTVSVDSQSPDRAF